jgi:queuine/archaeosine tRNA-ribosyltransferase
VRLLGLPPAWPGVPHHLDAEGALGRLLSIHNLRHYQVLMGRMREAILAGRPTALAGRCALWG